MEREWVKIRADLFRDPKVIRMALDLLVSVDLNRQVSQVCQSDMAITESLMRHAVVGGLSAVWSVTRADASRDNDDAIADGMSLTVIDSLVDIDGFGQAMASVGWVIEEPGPLLRFPKFFRNNVDREEIRRQRDRERKRKERQNVRGLSKEIPVTCPTREEKRRDTEEPPIAPQGAKETNGYCQSFIEWWEHYPRKVGKDAAYRAWRKAGSKIKAQMVCSSQEAAAHLLSRVVAYEAARQGEDPQFTPHPATWLNQGRWADDPATWKASKQEAEAKEESNMPPRFDEFKQIAKQEMR